MRDVYGKPPPGGRGTDEEALSRRSLLRMRMTPAAAGDIDWAEAIDRVRAAWDRDGHDALLRQLEPAADAVVELLGLRPGARLLDVGAGDGNLALAAVNRGAEVEACDLAAAMVARGRARAGAVRWREADVQALPYPSGRFDAVASTFGAVLAPRALTAARELARVTRPGGTVALAAWVPRGLPGRLGELVESVQPLPHGVPRPAGWGVDEVARRRLSPLLDELEIRTRTLQLRFASAEAAFEVLLRSHPLSPGQLIGLRPSFDRMLASCNNRPPEVEIDARYLVALGRRPSVPIDT